MAHIIKGIFIVVAITSMLFVGTISMITIIQSSFASQSSITATTPSSTAYDKVSTLRIGSGDVNDLYI